MLKEVENTRVANRLFKRIRDFALVMGNGNIDLKITATSLERLKVDELGLDNTDHQLLNAIILNLMEGQLGSMLSLLLLGKK